MKKCFAFLLCLMLTVLCAAPVSANSGPGHWESGPAYGMVPTKNCPITIEKEDLTFRMNKQNQDSDRFTAEVTATYHMKNPTSKPLDVEMAFPLISSNEQISTATNVHITALGKQLPYTLCFTGSTLKLGYELNLYDSDGKLNTSALPNFEIMLKNAVPVSDNPKYIKNGPAILYEIKVITGSYIRAIIKAPKDKTRILSFSGGEVKRSGDNIIINVEKGTDLNDIPFLAIGAKPTDIKVTAYDLKDHNKKFYEPDITSSQVISEDYCKTHIDDFSLGYADSLLERDGYCDIGLEKSELNDNHIFLLDYTVHFAANSEQDVSVSYPSNATMDDLQYYKLYKTCTFAYLSNPAKNWASFKNLNVTVIPSKNTYDLVASTIDLKKNWDGSYKAFLTDLPQDDIVFTFRDNTVAHTLKLILLIFLIFLAFIIFIIYFLKKSRIRKMLKNSSNHQ